MREMRIWLLSVLLILVALFAASVTLHDVTLVSDFNVAIIDTSADMCWVSDALSGDAAVMPCSALPSQWLD